MADEKYTYMDHVVYVKHSRFGIDRDGQVTYNEDYCVGHPHLYECAVFFNGRDEIQWLFDEGFSIYLMEGYVNRGAAVRMTSRAGVISKFGFANPAEINRRVIDELNSEARARMSKNNTDI